jgi:hypothetical protein
MSFNPKGTRSSVVQYLKQYVQYVDGGGVVTLTTLNNADRMMIITLKKTMIILMTRRG